MISKVRLIEQGGNQCIDIQNTCWNKGGGRGAGELLQQRAKSLVVVNQIIYGKRKL